MDIFRVFLGMAVAFWLPSSFMRQPRNEVVAAAWTAAYSLYALGPLLVGWRGWALWAVVLLAVIGLVLIRGRGEDWRKALSWLRVQVAAQVVLVAAGLVVTVAVATAFVFGWPGLSAVVTAVVEDKTAVVLSGLLGSVFCGNALVLLLVRTFSKIPDLKDENSADLALIGERIGWLERAVVFAFILGGQPSAAALAITAKSLARTPQISKSDRTFVEYFLVGTLSSLLVALAFAVATRLALGLTAL